MRRLVGRFGSSELAGQMVDAWEIYVPDRERAPFLHRPTWRRSVLHAHIVLNNYPFSRLNLAAVAGGPTAQAYDLPGFGRC